MTESNFDLTQVWAEGLKKSLDGMPSVGFEFEKFIFGYCMPIEVDIARSECEWSGVWDQII